MFSEREMSLLQAQSVPQSGSIMTTASVILQAVCKLLTHTGAITLSSNSENLLIFLRFNDAMQYSNCIASNTRTGKEVFLA
jgi:hypothetical protein